MICTRLHTLLECLPLNIGAFIALGFTIVWEVSGSTMLKMWLRRMWKLRLSPVLRQSTSLSRGGTLLEFES